MSGFDLIISPDEEEAEAAEIFVDGTVGGHPYRFLLDTGAARTRLAFDAYTATFPCLEQHSSSGVFAASTEEVIQVPSIELGPLTTTACLVVRGAAQHPDRRHLIGMDLLKEHCCHFVFDAQRVEVDPEEASAFSGSFQALLLDRAFHPYVEVQFEALTAQAVWDSGADLTIVDLNLVKNQPALFQVADSSRGTDATGAAQETPMFLMAATTIGGVAFPPQKVAGVDLTPVNATLEVPMDLILGYNTLRKANWLLDFPRQRWAISRVISMK